MKVTCKTRDELDQVYSQWNHKLYLMMQRQREKGLVPPEEPKFTPFDPVSCYDASEGAT